MSTDRLPAPAARPIVGGSLVVLAVAIGLGAARAPAVTLALAAGGVLVALVARRVSTSVALLCAALAFDGYLATSDPAVTPIKVIGAVVLAGWAVRWIVDRRPLVFSPMLAILAAWALWILISALGSQDHGAAVTAATRYWLFFLLTFLLVQVVADNPASSERILSIFVAAMGVAAVVGLVHFFRSPDHRAAGPIQDPNDFGLVLAVSLPLALHRLRQAVGSKQRAVLAAVVVVMGVTLAATLSRGAAVALGVGVAFALMRRQLSPRRLAGALVAIGVVVGIAYAVQPRRIDTAVTLKKHAATKNVERRFTTWDVATKELSAAPILGVGPGNYRTRFSDYALPEDLAHGAYVTHNAFLSVGAELGVPGLAFLVAFLGASAIGLRRQEPSLTTGEQGRREALLVSLVVAAVGCLFLDAQYLVPLWLVAGVGAGLGAPARDRSRAAPLAAASS